MFPPYVKIEIAQQMVREHRFRTNLGRVFGVGLVMALVTDGQQLPFSAIGLSTLLTEMDDAFAAEGFTTTPGALT